MRYFAMIDGERRGPYELSELREAGVGPDTYVWCRDMSDWEQAADVPDICRYWRQELARIMHPATVPATIHDGPLKDNPAPGKGDSGKPATGYRRMVFGPEEDSMIHPDEETLATPPATHCALAILVTLLFSPLTGAIAIYYSMLTRRLWNRSSCLKGEERRVLQREAHDSGRSANMWIGISFFLGLILWAFIFRFIV